MPAIELQINGVYIFTASTDTLLGPYLGKTVRKEQVDADKNNQWLWEVSNSPVTTCTCMCHACGSSEISIFNSRMH